MKAYRIDANQNRIDTVELSDDFRDISKQIGCEIFCVARTLPNGDTVYVDDEGYLNKNVKRGFIIGGQFFAGNGLMLGCDNDTGESQSVKTSLSIVEGLTQFMPVGAEISDKMRYDAMNSWQVILFS